MDYGAAMFKFSRDGLSIEEAAERLGIARSVAVEALRVYLTKLAEERALQAEHEKEIDLSRLERMTQVLMPQVESGSKLAIKTMLQVADRRAKLLGLNAAEKTESKQVFDLAAIIDIADRKKPLVPTSTSITLPPEHESALD